MQRKSSPRSFSPLLLSNFAYSPLFLFQHLLFHQCRELGSAQRKAVVNKRVEVSRYFFGGFALAGMCRLILGVSAQASTFFIGHAVATCKQYNRLRRFGHASTTALQTFTTDRPAYDTAYSNLQYHLESGPHAAAQPRYL